MALKILLVDPSDEWLDSARKYFEDARYEVETACNGRDAQLFLYREKYFACILNYDVKNHSGFQVLKFIQSSVTGLKTIVIVSAGETDEDNELRIEKARKHGASDVVLKPFELSDLKTSLEGHQSVGEMLKNIPKKEGVSNEEEVQGDDAQYTAIKIDQFYSSKAVLFDIFVKLGSGRFVKILHAGDTFSKERIDKYRNEKKVEHLYFHIKDRNKYIKYNSFLLDRVVENEKIGSEQKVKMLGNITSKFIEEAHAEGVKPLVVDQGKAICEQVFKLVEKNEDLYKTLKSFQDFDPNAYTHAFLTTLYSSAIIKQFEWQSKVTIENMSMACMFHDIGKMKLDPSLLEKRPADMSESEYKDYQKHPELGVEMIEGNRMINNSIKQIIFQHHEAYDGSGFPHGKKGKSVLTLANILCLTDDFVHKMIDEKLTPTIALRTLITDSNMVARYNSVILENFIKIFVDPSKIVKENKEDAEMASRVVNKKAS